MLCRFRPFYALFVLVVISLLLQELCASVVGTVTDTSGAVMPDAIVTMINVATGGTCRIRTNNAGAFTATNVQSGTYNVTTETSRFRKVIIPSLPVGQTIETIMVQASSVKVHTSHTAVAHVIRTSKIDKLPQFGDSPLGLAALENPGVEIEPANKGLNNQCCRSVTDPPNLVLITSTNDFFQSAHWLIVQVTLLILLLISIIKLLRNEIGDLLRRFKRDPTLHTCAHCGQQLTAAPEREAGEWILRCLHCGNHNTIVPVFRLVSRR